MRLLLQAHGKRARPKVNKPRIGFIECLKPVRVYWETTVAAIPVQVMLGEVASPEEQPP